MTSSDPRIAHIYARLSQDRNGKSPNIDIQVSDCRALAGRLGIPVGKVFSDRDVSASGHSKKRRPGYDALVAEIQASTERVAVLAHHPSRLHRRPRELDSYIDLSKARGVVTHTVNAGRWDLSTASGIFQARILCDADAYESDLKSERVRAKRAAQAKLGAFSGGIRPYGYEKDGITVIEKEAEVIRSVVDSVVMFTNRRGGGEGPADISLRYLVRDLNVRGITTSTGKQWTSLALKALILSPRIAGLSSYKGEILWSVESEWPAIVERDQWLAARATLNDVSRRKEYHRGGLVKWLGSGLYVCGVCQQPSLRVTSTNTGRRTYRCNRRQNADQGGHVSREANSLDRFVEQVLVARLSDPRVLAKLADTAAETPVDVAALEVEQAAIDRLLEEQAEMHAAGELTRAQVIAGSKRLAERQKEIDGKLAQAGSRTPLEPLINRKGKTMAEVWYGPGGPASDDRRGGLSLVARRAIIQRVVTITVNKTTPGKFSQRGGGYLDPNAIDFDWHKS